MKTIIAAILSTFAMATMAAGPVALATPTPTPTPTPALKTAQPPIQAEVNKTKRAYRDAQREKMGMAASAPAKAASK